LCRLVKQKGAGAPTRPFDSITFHQLMMFLFLFIPFILLVVKFYSLASAASTFNATESADWAVGGEIIFDGFIAGYVATADRTNWTYGRKVLPV
jgi:succinate-acetate transporter protein